MTEYLNNDIIVEEELLEDFMILDEEENKLINYLKDEFSNYTFFNYGKIVYIQQLSDFNFFPHISELLENYENIYSKPCYTGNLVLRQRKCKYIKMTNRLFNYFSLYYL